MLIVNLKRPQTKSGNFLYVFIYNNEMKQCFITATAVLTVKSYGTKVFFYKREFG